MLVLQGSVMLSAFEQEQPAASAVVLRTNESDAAAAAEPLSCISGALYSYLAVSTSLGRRRCSFLDLTCSFPMLFYISTTFLFSKRFCQEYNEPSARTCGCLAWSSSITYNFAY